MDVLQIKKQENREKNIRMLIVDDETDMCWLLSRIFQDAGYEVTTATTGKEALTEVEKEEPELVILDVKLPDISGIQVLSTINKVKPEIVEIMISAYGSEEMRKEAMRIGAYDFIDKPFNIEALLRTVRKAISNKARFV